MKRRVKKPILAAIIFLLVLGSLFLVFKLFDKNEQDDVTTIDEIEIRTSNIIVDEKEYKIKNNLDVMLFTGIDSYDKQKSKENSFADCNLLLVFDHDKKTILPIHINRNLMCEMNELETGGKIKSKQFKQLAYAYGYGDADMLSLINIKNSVSSLFNNININNYLLVNYSAISTIADNAQGIDVLIEDDFTGVDDSLVSGETITLKGKQALNYVRPILDKEDAGSNECMKRQRTFLKSFFNKCKIRSEDSKYIDNVFSKIENDLLSNQTLNDLTELAKTFVEYNILGSIVLEGENKKVGNQNEYYVDQSIIDDICVKYILTEVEKGGN